MIGGQLNHGLVQQLHEIRAQLFVTLVHLEFDALKQSLKGAYGRVIHHLKQNQATLISELNFASCLSEVK